jgi:hypothetical protein
MILHQWECQTRQQQGLYASPIRQLLLQPCRQALGEVRVKDASQQIGRRYSRTHPGAGQPNQIWQGVPMMTEGGKEYVNLEPKHGQILDVSEGSDANGAHCTSGCQGLVNQPAWTFKSVESNDTPRIPT